MRTKIPFPIAGGDYVHVGDQLARAGGHEPIVQPTAPASAAPPPAAATHSKRKPGKSKTGNQE